MCRCRASGDVRHTYMLVCAATLWHTQSWVSVCADRLHLASLHKLDRALQHHPLEPPCVSSAFAILHVSISQEDSERWLDVTGWNPSLCYRYGQGRLLPTYCLAVTLLRDYYTKRTETYLKCYYLQARKLCMQILDISRRDQFR